MIGDDHFQNGEFKKALLSYKLALNLGLNISDVKEIYARMGNSYYHETNFSLAKKYYNLAANAGCVISKLSLASCYEREGSTDEANRNYCSAANHFHPLAILKKAFFHVKVENNINSAIDLINEFIILDYAKKFTIKEILPWIESMRSASLNEQYQLALSLLLKHYDICSLANDFYLKNDFDNAIKYYTYAFPESVNVYDFLACRGMNDGIKKWGEISLWLGNHYFNQKDFVNSFFNYKKALYSDVTISNEVYSRLGSMYYHGKGIEKNYFEAFKYFTLSVNNFDIEEEEALKHCHDLAEQNQPIGMLCLALFSLKINMRKSSDLIQNFINYGFAKQFKLEHIDSFIKIMRAFAKQDVPLEKVLKNLARQLHEKKDPITLADITNINKKPSPQLKSIPEQAVYDNKLII